MIIGKPTKSLERVTIKTMIICKRMKSLEQGTIKNMIVGSARRDEVAEDGRPKAAVRRHRGETKRSFATSRRQSEVAR